MIPPSTNGDNDDDDDDDDDNSKSKIVKYEGDDYKRRKLQDFFNEHALKEPVFEPINVVNDENGTDGTDTDNDASATPPKEDDTNKKEEESKKEKQESPGGDEF